MPAPSDARPRVSRRNTAIRIEGQTYDMEIAACPTESMQAAIARHATDAASRIARALLTANRLNAAADALADDEREQRKAVTEAQTKPAKIWNPCSGNNDGTHRMCALHLGNLAQVAKALGPPNMDDDPQKVAASYQGRVRLPSGELVRVCLWDWKGSAEDSGQWSMWCADESRMLEACHALSVLVAAGGQP